MTSSSKSIVALLTRLQRQVRVRTPPGDDYVRSFRLPPDLRKADAEMLMVTQDVADTMSRISQALAEDLHFEYLDDSDEALRDLVGRAWANETVDQVQPFIARYSRELLKLVCYIPIEYLELTESVALGDINLLPLDDARIPTEARPSFDHETPIGSVAAVRVAGTHLGKMASRAQAHVAHQLRIARVGLQDVGIHDSQLRFRMGVAYAFDNNLSGWRSRPDTARSLTLTATAIAKMGDKPVWTMPFNPLTDVERKADLALRWMERARFTGEPLIALLYLFFALEALLGDKSEKLKADMLAFRQLVLSHVVTGRFREPNTTWLLYDQVRSAAVHGEDAPPVDKVTVDKFEWAVRDTLNEFLTFARSQHIARRYHLMAQLISHPDVPQLVDWIRSNAGADWEGYLETVIADLNLSRG